MNPTKAYGIILKGDPEHNLIKSIRGHHVWFLKSSAACAMSALCNKWNGRYRKSDLELVELEITDANLIAEMVLALKTCIVANNTAKESPWNPYSPFAVKLAKLTHTEVGATSIAE